MIPADVCLAQQKENKLIEEDTTTPQKRRSWRVVESDKIETRLIFFFFTNSAGLGNSVIDQVCVLYHHPGIVSSGQNGQKSSSNSGNKGVGTWDRQRGETV
ncbi:hypothetical protein RRG08_022283 [Elysia crispata]|uniref:Uncharacterized protein n=1 Tax=Elysia crispata TaxID=231223 RepID=A0AAE0ZQ72_9GAST|nr:hypothetical protein RRG08_022283 [Elysia crispata]